MSPPLSLRLASGYCLGRSYITLELRKLFLYFIAYVNSIVTKIASIWSVGTPAPLCDLFLHDFLFIICKKCVFFLNDTKPKHRLNIQYRNGNLNQNIYCCRQYISEHKRRINIRHIQTSLWAIHHSSMKFAYCPKTCFNC